MMTMMQMPGSIPMMSFGMGMPMVAVSMPEGAMPGGKMPMTIPCKMTFEMSKDGILCKMTPESSGQIDVMKACCDAMNAMMAMGCAVVLTCNGAPMMMSVPAPHR